MEDESEADRRDSVAVPTDRAGLSREIWRLALPATLQNLLQTAMFWVDTKMVATYAADLPGGPTAGTVPIAALAVIGPLAWSLTVIFTVTAVGTTAVVGRRIGSGDPKAARSVTVGAAWLALIIGTLVGVAGVLGAEPLVRGVLASSGKSDSTELVFAASSYLWWFFLLFPFRVLALTLIGALRGAGDTATPFWGGLVANGANVVGNALFIFGLWGLPALGVEGAGIGMGIAGVAEVVYVIWVLFRKKRGRLNLRWSDARRVERRDLRSVLQVSGGAFGDAVVFHAGFIVYQLAIFHLSEAQIAAHRIAITLQSLAFMPAVGFYAAASSLSGRLLGADRKELAFRAAGLNVLYGLLFLSPVMVLFVFGGTPLAAYFSGDQVEVYPLAATCLMIGALEVPFLLITESLRGTLRGAGETRQPMWVTVIGTWLVRVPGAWYLAIELDWGLTGIWATTVVDWIVRAAVMVILFRRGSWRERVV